MQLVPGGATSVTNGTPTRFVLSDIMPILHSITTYPEAR